MSDENGKAVIEENEVEETYLLPHDLAQEVMTYLVSRPFIEVFGIVQALQAVQTSQRSPSQIRLLTEED